MTPLASVSCGRTVRDSAVVRSLQRARRSTRWLAALAALLAIAPRPASAQGDAVLGPLVDQWVSRPVDAATLRSFLPFFEYDRRLPFDVRVTASSDSGGLLRERLSFISTSGERVTAYYVRPTSEAPGTRSAAIFLHGGSALGKDTPRYTDFVDFFARAGVPVLAIDLPHFGERRSGLLVSFTEREKHDRLYNQPATYLAFVTQVVKDVGRAYDFLVAERNTDADRILLLGFSRGAQLSYIVGGVERRLKGVAALYGGHMDHQETGHHPAACPANYIGLISPRPLFTMNGRFDADYSRDSTVLPLHALARQPHRAVWLDTGHLLPPEQQRAELVAWMRGLLAR